MKKLGLVIALVAVGLLTSKSYADVQNIRLSGDIRIRGYFLSKADSDNNTDDNFISQRTRITCEADLEDHVLVVVTLKAEGMWGQRNQDDDVVDGSGAGMNGGGWSGTLINRNWDIGVSEAYVQLSEVFYTPATLKLGRQYLNYGRGLILSSAEQEYNFDAARLVLDYYPLTIDLVWARAIEASSFSSGGGTHAAAVGDANMLFANARYEMTDSLIKDIEAYVGYMGTYNQPFSTTVPPTVFGSSPVIIGLRTDLNLTKGLQTWAEAAYECGAGGNDDGISAWLLNAGASFTVPNCQWAPVFNASYTYATGGDENSSRNQFRPWFNYQDGYNGYLLHPALSNIQIFNLGAAVKPAKNVTLSEQVYYYLKDNKDGPSASAYNMDFGQVGPGFIFGDGKEIGWEMDTILGYDYSKDVRCQLVYAVFLPDKNVRDISSGSSCFHEIRGELNVKF